MALPLLQLLGIHSMQFVHVTTSIVLFCCMQAVTANMLLSAAALHCVKAVHVYLCSISLLNTQHAC
jgi:hypothetical protein